MVINIVDNKNKGLSLETIFACVFFFQFVAQKRGVAEFKNILYLRLVILLIVPKLNSPDSYSF